MLHSHRRVLQKSDLSDIPIASAYHLEGANVQEYLQRWKKTLVVVSHDRDFLNMVTTDIIHLHDERLHAYRGNFAQFEEMYEQRRREVNKVAEKFEKQMKVAKKSGSKANQDKVRCTNCHNQGRN